MYNTVRVKEDLIYVGASDRRIALFENAYPVSNGISYNSYVFLDEKTALMDTVDWAIAEQFRENLLHTLDGRNLDYVVVSHMEPDHCSTLGIVLDLYPDVTIVGNIQVKKMISQFYGRDVSDHFQAVKEGDTLSLGRHTLTFIGAPMVHWPEVMMSYEPEYKILFSADAFGKFGALSGNLFASQTDVWKTELSEARRYYCNIVGKFGANVSAVLKKAAALDIAMICPLHGPVLDDDLSYYLDKYTHWSGYTPEDETVLIAYGSIYGGTQNAADILASLLAEKGVKNIRVYDVSSTHYSTIVAEAFRASTLVFASPTQDARLFAPMEIVLNELKSKNLSKRNVALIENGTWAPMAAKPMRAVLESMKEITFIGETVSLLSTPQTNASRDDRASLNALADAIVSTLA